MVLKCYKISLLYGFLFIKVTSRIDFFLFSIKVVKTLPKILMSYLFTMPFAKYKRNNSKITHTWS